MQVAVRVDLPPSPATPGDFEPLTSALRNSHASAVAAVVYAELPPSAAVQRSEWLPLTSAVEAAVRAADLKLIDILIVSKSTWWSLLCTEPSCCPREGTARAIGCSAAAAAATVAGLVALDDRAAVEAQLAGDAELKRRELEPHLEMAEHRVTRAVLNNGVARLVQSDLDALAEAARVRAGGQSLSAQTVPSTHQALTPHELARFGVALADTAIRDEMWVAIDEGSMDAEQLLRELLHRLPAPYDAAPLFLLGWHQWRAGNGTVAGMAAERALESDRGYSAARLLLQAVRSGLDPRNTPRLRNPDTP